MFLRLNKPTIVFQNLEGEAVAINVDKGSYYSLNTSATAIVEYLENQQSVEMLIAELAAATEAGSESTEALVQEFLQGLIDEGILVEAESEAAVNDGAQLQLSEFTPPAFECHFDMQEFLLLDPIHEVSDRGWPHPAEKSENEEDDGTKD